MPVTDQPLLTACRSVFILSLLAAGHAAAQSDHSAASFTIERHANAVTITGDVSSTAHEAILRQTALDLYPDLQLEFNMQQRGTQPPGWALLTEMIVRAMAKASSASATIDPTTVLLQGMTDDRDAWASAMAALRSALLPGMSIDDQVIVAATGGSMQAHCLRILEDIAGNARIEFGEESAALRPAAFQALDELVEVATNCADASIVVEGHTDRSGNEAANASLSQQRAEAVVDYLVARGLDRGRLRAVGRGSAAPLVSGNNPYARRANRRITFVFEFP